MMLLGILFFLAGLYLVITHNRDGLIGFNFGQSSKSALDIAKERYARGEISTEEFQTIKSVLAEDKHL